MKIGRPRVKIKIVYRTRPLPKPKPTFENAPDLLTTSEVSRFLNVSKMQVYHLMEQGMIRATLINRPDAKRVRYRFLKEDVDRLRNRRLVFTRSSGIKSYDK